MPTCDLCHQNHLELYDAPILGAGGSWGYICGPCVTIKGPKQVTMIEHLGCRISLRDNAPRPSPNPVDEEQWAARIPIDSITEMVLGEKPVHALDGCRVDPDGQCQHGFRSPLLILGVH